MSYVIDLFHSFAAAERPSEATTFINNPTGQKCLWPFFYEATYQWRHQQGQSARSDVVEPVPDHSEQKQNFPDGHSSHVHSGQLACFVLLIIKKLFCFKVNDPWYLVK